MIHPITTLFDQNSELPYLVHGKFPALFIERSHKKELSPTYEQKAYFAFAFAAFKHFFTFFS
jgi:hypothetical protein